MNVTLVSEMNSTISNIVQDVDSMLVVSAAIASVGIIANLAVAVTSFSSKIKKEDSQYFHYQSGQYHFNVKKIMHQN